MGDLAGRPELIFDQLLYPLVGKPVVNKGAILVPVTHQSTRCVLQPLQLD